MATGSHVNEDKDLLLSRYQDLEWTDDVTAFQCGRCTKVLINHYIANCGHKFCLNCKKLLDDGSKRWRCPLPDCKNVIEDIHLQDFYFEETVFEQRAKCPNHKYGCPFQAPLKDIAGHLRKCQDTRENALPVLLDENKKFDDAFVGQLSKLNEKMAAMGLTLDHLREKEVAQKRRWAEQDRKFAEMKALVESVSQCLTEVTSMATQNSSQLLALNERISEEISSLKLKEIGDNFRPLSAAEVVYNSIIRPEVQRLRRVDEYYKEKPDFTWTVSNKSGILAGSENKLISEVFPLRGHPFSVQVKMKIYNELISLSLSFQDTNETNKKPEIKPIPNFCLTFKDQSENKERKDIIITTILRINFKEEFKFNEFYGVHVVTKSVFYSPLYHVNDNVVIDVHVEAPEVAQSVYSYDGTLTWAIDNFRKRKQMEVEGLMHYHLSPYFYTSPKGYRVQVQTWVNGSKNKGVSVYINFLDGLHDKDLNDVFPHRTTLTIFHPTQPTRNISQSKKNDRADFYWFHMESEAEIENLLYEDTLYYKVKIETL